MFDKVKRALHRRSVGPDGHNFEKPARFDHDVGVEPNTHPAPSRYSEDDYIHKQRGLRHRLSLEGLRQLRSSSRRGSVRSFQAFGDEPSQHPAIHPLDAKPLPRSPRTSTDSLVPDFRERARGSSISAMGPNTPQRGLGESAIPNRTTSKRKTGGYHQPAPTSLPSQPGAHKRYAGPPQPYRHLDVGNDFRSGDLPDERGEPRASTTYRDSRAERDETTDSTTYGKFPAEDNNRTIRLVTDRNQDAPSHVPDRHQGTSAQVPARKPVASTNVTTRDQDALGYVPDRHQDRSAHLPFQDQGPSTNVTNRGQDESAYSPDRHQDTSARMPFRDQGAWGYVTDQNQDAPANVKQSSYNTTTGIYETIPPTTLSSGATISASMTIDHTTHNHPAVTHHDIRPHTHTIYEPKRTRSYHYHEQRTLIQPIVDSEPRILPEEHYVQDWKTGKTFWIPPNIGRELDRIGGPRRTELVKDGDLIGAMERVRIRDDNGVPSQHAAY